MAVALGMDVPFFLGRSPAFAWGRGEELRTLRASTGLSLVLANPGFPLATRDAIESGRLKRGDLVVFVSVGAGYTVGANLWRWSY
jgi:4-diphosphocytidyl-2C-methyl-D-erythritol kinase